MKKYVYSIIYWVSLINIGFSAGPNRVPQLEDAYAEAQNTKQKIVAIFGADWCGFCKQLDKDILDNPTVLDNYIYVYINIDERSDLKKEYDVKNIPDIMILHNGIEKKRKVGYKGLDKLKKWLDE